MALGPRSWLLAVLSGAALGAGCSKAPEPVTELVLVADSDVPYDELESLTLTVTRRDVSEPPHQARVELSAASALPATLGVLYEGGPLGPITVSAVGKLKTHSRSVTRTHVVSFVKGKTLAVPLHLARHCLNEALSCADDETCTERGCEAQARGTLEPYRPGIGIGEVTPLDGGQPITDASVDGGALDAGADAAASLMNCGSDGLVDVTTNREHCGSCNNRCDKLDDGKQHFVGVCKASQCETECELHWADCSADGDPACNVELNTDLHCGACDIECKGARECIELECRVPP